MRFGLKKAIDSLPKKHRENFIEDLKALYIIDPFRHSVIVAIIFLFFLFSFKFTIAMIIMDLYLFWVLIYFVTFLGVNIMWKRKRCFKK